MKNMKKNLSVIIFSLIAFLAISSTALSQPAPPPQPEIGPGGSNYQHADVTISGPFWAEGHSMDDKFKYFLFEPAAPKPTEAPVVLFLHGIRAFNPEYYLEWINHIVKKGHTVAWVQYDDGWTLVSRFPEFAMVTWKDALNRLESEDHVRPETDATGEAKTAYVGHSVGAYVGALLAGMSALPTFALPKPYAVVSIEPGEEIIIPATHLEYIDPATKMVFVVGDEDLLVCTRTATRIWELTPQIPDENRDYLLVMSDYTGSPPQIADHLFPVTSNVPLDSALFGYLLGDYDDPLLVLPNYTGLPPQIGDPYPAPQEAPPDVSPLGYLPDDFSDPQPVDARDFFITFKLSVGALNCAFRGTDCEYALGDGSDEQISMGAWSDGQPVTPMAWVENPSSLVPGCFRFPPLPPNNFFAEVAPQGFGDRHNSKAWSMIWWKNNLYVGTARAHLCVEYAGLAEVVGKPFFYPPVDPDQDCTPSPQDLPLQAEIWRYDPVGGVWDRVFRSPNNVEIPDYPGKFTARDAGFRNIIAFTEPDGTEALYAGGVTSEAINPGMPPPRILRTIDGENWQPIPQDPGTVIGDLGRGQANWRAMAVYKNRLFAVIGDLRGGGAILEAENPAGGNDNFQFVSPEGMKIYEMAVFNDYLYIGTDSIGPDGIDGYAVAKTDATGTPPYTFTTVVEKGGDRDVRPSLAVTSMFVFNGSLYIGTDKPAEIIRIHSDDSWDLLVGRTRITAEGLKEPMSGMRAGFNDLLNQHMWRMGEYKGKLYVGTNDARAFIKEYLWFQPWLTHMGFDLASTIDGVEYTMLTNTGLEKQLDIGIRVFGSTPVGFFFGTSNPFNGLRIYQSCDGVVDPSDLSTLLADFGRSSCDQGEICEADFYGDNDVDSSDLSIIVQKIRNCLKTDENN